MKDDKATDAAAAANSQAAPSRFFGSLREALHAASRDDRSGVISVGSKARPEPAATAVAGDSAASAEAVVPPALPPVAGSAAEALREAKARPRGHYEHGEPTTIAIRPLRGVAASLPSVAPAAADDRTRVVRGKPKINRDNFPQDPVVGWLVVVGGPGLGSYRPIFEGNNAIGRSPQQRVPLDFGDDTISAEEQAYIRYDSLDRSFLFVPNLTKTNIVSVNDKKPTTAVALEMMDVIRMGQTQLAFVPFCGEAFDWSELAELKE